MNVQQIISCIQDEVTGGSAERDDGDNINEFYRRTRYLPHANLVV